MTLDPATAEIYRRRASDWRDARVGKPLGPAGRFAAALDGSEDWMVSEKLLPAWDWNEMPQERNHR